MIEFTNVNKKYQNGVTGLHNITLNIEDGEFVFIVGSSGSGKSTFLKMINRQERATSGRIVVNGTDVTRLSRFQTHKLRRKVGVVFQDFKLLPNLTVYQNVAFALEAMGLSTAEVRKKSMQVINQVGLGHKVLVYPNQLSGGEQQRVAIARAIANNPDVIVADEPTGNLDPDNSQQIMAILRQLNKDGKTVLMATHNYDLIYERDCRVISIDRGTISKDEVMGYYEIK